MAVRKSDRSAKIRSSLSMDTTYSENYISKSVSGRIRHSGWETRLTLSQNEVVFLDKVTECVLLQIVNIRGRSQGSSRNGAECKSRSSSHCVKNLWKQVSVRFSLCPPLTKLSYLEIAVQSIGKLVSLHSKRREQGNHNINQRQRTW